MWGSLWGNGRCRVLETHGPVLGITVASAISIIQLLALSNHDEVDCNYCCVLHVHSAHCFYTTVSLRSQRCTDLLEYKADRARRILSSLTLFASVVRTHVETSAIQADACRSAERRECTLHCPSHLFVHDVFAIHTLDIPPHSHS